MTISVDEYKSKKSPITSYAKSKMLCEKYLTNINFLIWKK